LPWRFAAGVCRLPLTKLSLYRLARVLYKLSDWRAIESFLESGY
jgi:hypothetical protein